MYKFSLKVLFKIWSAAYNLGYAHSISKKKDVNLQEEFDKYFSTNIINPE